VHEKQSKLDEQQRQKQCDEAMRKHENASLAASNSLGSHESVSATGTSLKRASSALDIGGRLQFVDAWCAKLDNAIGNLVMEEATPLALVGKLAFREAINTAIEFGAQVGVQVYVHSGKKRLRNETIPRVIAQQDRSSVMLDFDRKLARFGGTLVSDGKDDVSSDHLINYLTVCPDGYRFELSRDVTGLRRKSEWVADDLLAELGELEGALKLKLDSALARMEAAEHEQLEKNEDEQAADYLTALKNSILAFYVQIITDTPSVNAKAWALIEAQVPHLLANPCVFHCLNLYFTHLLKGDKTGKRVKVIVMFY